MGYRVESFARAAMLGLLAAAQSACGSDTSTNEESRGGDDVDDPSLGESDDDTTASGGSTPSSDSASGGDESSNGTAGDGGAGGAVPVEGVLSTKIIPDLSLEDFTALCGEEGGVVETHAVCGGVVSGPGFSYDDATYAFTEHTCAGYNTCSGFSCVIDGFSG